MAYSSQIDLSQRLLRRHSCFPQLRDDDLVARPGSARARSGREGVGPEEQARSQSGSTKGKKGYGGLDGPRDFPWRQVVC